MQIYRAFGLSLSSEFQLPELPRISMKEGQIDIIISKIDLSVIWFQLAEPEKYFVVKKNVVFFRVPGVAVFMIAHGKEIMVSPIGESREDQIRLYLLGTCMGALFNAAKNSTLTRQCNSN